MVSFPTRPLSKGKIQLVGRCLVFFGFLACFSTEEFGLHTNYLMSCASTILHMLVLMFLTFIVLDEFFIVFVITGEWMLVDKCLGLALINRFNVKEVYKCLVHWGTGIVNLVLWSGNRPVSKQSPLTIFHEYEVIRFPSLFNWP